MIRGKFYTEDGVLVFINGVDDFKTLVRKRIGHDAAQIVQELVDLSNGVDTDLQSYETQLEGNQKAFEEIREAAADLMWETGARRINRKTLEKLIQKIQMEVSNQL